MSDFQYFRKNQFVITSDSHTIDVPEYVLGSKKRYKFDPLESIMYKQCTACETWFQVARLDGESWTDVHKESELHYTKSGYGSYCRQCMPAPPEHRKDAVSLPSTEAPKNIHEKYSVFIADDHKAYLKARAALSNKTIRVVLGEIIEKEKTENPLKIYL